MLNSWMFHIFNCCGNWQVILKIKLLDRWPQLESWLMLLRLNILNSLTVEQFGFVLWPQNEILDSTRPLKLNPLLNNSVGFEIKLIGPFNYLLNFFNRERTISENFHSSNETKPIAKKFVTEGLSSWSMKNPLFFILFRIL